MSTKRDYKPRKYRQRKRQARRNSLLVILLLLVAGFAALLSMQRNSGHDQPIAATATPAQPPAATANKPPSPTQTTGPKYRFYDELPKRKVELYSRQTIDSSTAQSTTQTPGRSHTNPPRGKPIKPERYMVQAGAFRDFADADKVRAQLAFLGIKARIERTQQSTKPWHRVRIGPLTDRASVAAVRQKLDQNNIPALTLTLNR